MTARQYRFAAAALLASFALAPAPAAALQADPQPRLGFSVGDVPPGSIADGPLFQRARAAFAAARRSDEAFAPFLAHDAALELITFPNGTIQRTPFTAATVRAAAESCLGPYSFSEGPGWAQLSWICRVDGTGPLAALITFRDSPELSLTIWFENGLIKTIEAMEPPLIPGARRVSMEAYAAMRGRR